jgi:hypothetical protein
MVEIGLLGDPIDLRQRSKRLTVSGIRVMSRFLSFRRYPITKQCIEPRLKITLDDDGLRIWLADPSIRHSQPKAVK